jgi:hypothetical protein
MNLTEPSNLPEAGCAEMRGGGFRPSVGPASGFFAYSKYEGLISQRAGGSSYPAFLMGGEHRGTGEEIPGQVSALEECAFQDRHQIGYLSKRKSLESDSSPFSSFYPLSPMGREVSKSGGSPGT